ncbi:hypothetical protein JAAARDRAFT_174251 [Jaapia argillacea MUCL 33604]|uniref:Uncharacterized protein n=1 Tax=Jaapia argillacea MUCL 33604 TaxID=933084 RepID=A0A067QCA7_9AGAM|nr:hypothetical protein JAAARDRAFT_174251 [Jaapia argillacea MUCL 33604]
MSNEDFSISQLSLHSNEDWDRSESDIQPDDIEEPQYKTPRNSVAFPAGTSTEDTPGRTAATGLRLEEKGKRTLSELLKLYAEKGTDVKFSQEEASRVADVLGQWINSGSSPYEGEDDFFARSQDDMSLASKRSPIDPSRPRGQSESVVNSRPSSRAAARPS